MWGKIRDTHQSPDLIMCTSKRNILGGIWVHPRHLNPDRPSQWRGRVLAVHFSDPTLLAVRSESGPCSRGPRRWFPRETCESPLSLPLTLMCGPASTGSQLSGTNGTWRSGAVWDGQGGAVVPPVVLLPPQGQNRLFTLLVVLPLQSRTRVATGEATPYAGLQRRRGRPALACFGRGMRRAAAPPTPTQISSPPFLLLLPSMEP
jgi:hypothetical protein